VLESALACSSSLTLCKKNWMTMKLWMSAEIEADIADENRAVRNEVERAINARIGTRSYKLHLNGWDVIVILRDDDEFPEITEYSHRRRDMDFRLRLDYTKFNAASHSARCRMYINLLLRSIDILQEKGLETEELNKLATDTMLVAKEQRWA
jgi:hypothetical protein